MSFFPEQHPQVPVLGLSLCVSQLKGIARFGLKGRAEAGSKGSAVHGSKSYLELDWSGREHEILSAERSSVVMATVGPGGAPLSLSLVLLVFDHDRHH